MISLLVKFGVLFLTLITTVLFLCMFLTQIVNTFAFHVEEDRKSAGWRFIMMFMAVLLWSIYITWFI